MTNKTFVLCDGNVLNSHGFRIDLDGMDISRFLNNPVMLYEHNSSIPSGRWENIRLNIEDNKLLADADFDVADEESAKIAGKVERGFLKAASVGIIIHQMKKIKGVLTATKTELLEASIVAIPSDRGALALYDKNYEKLDETGFKQQLKALFNINNNNFSTMDENQISKLQADLAASEQRVQELEAKVAELSAKAEQAQAATRDAYLSAAEQAGKITAAEKAVFAKLSVVNFDEVKEVIDLRQPQKSFSLAAQTQPASGSDTVALAAEWDKLDKECKLANLRATDIGRYRELYAAKFGV